MLTDDRRRIGDLYRTAIAKGTGLTGRALGKAVGYSLLARDLAKLSPGFLQQLYEVA